MSVLDFDIFHKTVAAEYLRQYLNIADLRILNLNTEDVMGLDKNGEITSQRDNIKTYLDFSWHYSGFECYAHYSYITEEKSLSEQIKIIDIFQYNKQNNVILLLICDGCFYTRQKLELLSSHNKKRNLIICQSDQILCELSKEVSPLDFN